jgi:CubicO group peptidase (beta-lactamase class C family)
MDLFTALLALRLVDEGTLEAGQPLSKYVEGLAWEGQRVTLHHLLTHTSGVPDIEGVAAELKVVEAMFRVQDPWKQIAAQPLLSTPGTCQTFNGMNTYLTGKVLEAVVDAPLREQVQSVLLGPLGMTGTRYADDAAAQLDEVGYQVVCAGALETDPSGTASSGRPRS